MENIDVVCPDPEFKLFVRERFEKIQKCLANKVSWAMSGVVVAVFSAIAFLVFSAYSTGQEEQCGDIKENSAQVQELKTNVKVMKVEFHHVKQALESLKAEQESQFNAVMKELKQIQKKGGEEE